MLPFVSSCADWCVYVYVYVYVYVSRGSCFLLHQNMPGIRLSFPLTQYSLLRPHQTAPFPSPSPSPSPMSVNMQSEEGPPLVAQPFFSGLLVSPPPTRRLLPRRQLVPPASLPQATPDAEFSPCFLPGHCVWRFCCVRLLYGCSAVRRSLGTHHVRR